jgi:hypothetical protein
MHLISHRGNILGSFPEKENNPTYIDCAINSGYDVEIDIHLIDNQFWLGHDEPQYKITGEWLTERVSSLWIHCKNIDALYYFSANQNNYNYFWHQNDDFTLTSKNYIWTYPGKEYTTRSIIVMPEWNTDIDGLGSLKSLNCHGICSDYVGVI